MLLFLINAGSALGTLSGNPRSLDKFVVFLEQGAVDVLFENGFSVDLLKLGFEVVEASFIAAAIGTTTLVGHSEAGICYLLAFDAPDASPC